MNPRLPTLLDDLFPNTTPEFSAIAEVWPAHTVNQMLELVWSGFDRLKALPNFKSIDFTKDYAQLERCLTDLHMDEIIYLWGVNSSRFESFIPKQEPWEFENLWKRSARPPSYDLGFVLLSNRRFRWSIEAKVLEKATSVARYLQDVDKFITGQGAPFAAQAAIGAYLVSGNPDEFFKKLSKALRRKLSPSKYFLGRPHCCSSHRRSKRSLHKNLSTSFICHHLVFALN